MTVPPSRAAAPNTTIISKNRTIVEMTMLFFAARGSISPLFQIRMNADIKLAEHVKIPAINATASIAFSKEANTHTDTAAINARSLARRPDAF